VIVALQRAVLFICLGSLLNGPARGQPGAKSPADPQLQPSDIVNAADYSSGGVTPGEVVVIYPSNAGPLQMSPWGLNGNMRQATLVGETRVLFDGLPATIMYSVRGQVGAIVPHEIAGKKTTQVVVEYQGRRSPPVTLAVIDGAPALFTLDASGKGQAAMLNETGCCNSVRNPAVRGKPASLYATGEGQLSGTIARNVSVTVGGVPAQVLYTGNFGALQVNFRVPANAPLGDAIPLVLTVGGRPSSSAVTMAVRSARRRVLVLSDNAAIRRRLAGILGRAGYPVLTWRGQQGATAQAAGPPDLIIFDLAMPKEEVSEIVRTLRIIRPQLRILATSSALDPESLRAADFLGAQAILARPLNAVQVLARVRTLLEMRPAVY
jgi:uncharacterized protein (TIGR03437 family)